jgi:hypothetical protein
VLLTTIRRTRYWVVSPSATGGTPQCACSRGDLMGRRPLLTSRGMAIACFASMPFSALLLVAAPTTRQAHAGSDELQGRAEGEGADPFVDAGACGALAESSRKALEARVSKALGR